MKDPILYKAIIGIDTPKLEVHKHDVDTFVDDSFNCIAINSTAIVKPYLEKYYELMHSF